MGEWLRERNAAVRYWRYLLVIPVLGGFFVVATAAVSWLGRRRFRER